MNKALLDFRETADRAGDLAPALRRAARSIPSGTTLVFPEGDWILHPEGAASESLAVTNHDDGARLTAFSLADRSDITLEGEGCTLRSLGKVSPFWFRNCRGLSLRNLTLDRAESQNRFSEVVEVTEDRVVVRLDPAWNGPWSVYSGEVHLEGTHWREKIRSLIEWDREGRHPVAGSGDNLGAWGNHWTFEPVDREHLAIRGRSSRRPAVGNWLTLRSLVRPAPGIVLDGCEAVRLESVLIHAAAGMGLIAQRSRDIDLRACATAPSPRGPGVYSDLEDATHFANCGGIIRLEGCRFQGQLDDGCNIHGAYFPVVRRLDDHSVVVERRHFQQAGAPVGGPGERFAIAREVSLEDYWTGRARAVEDLNRHYARVVFEDRLPDDLAMGDALDNLDWHPDAVLRRCDFRYNRARGVLLSSRGKVLVEACSFRSSGAAIQAAGGLGLWCESGPVGELTVRNCEFHHCAVEPAWGRAVLQIGPESGDPGQRSTPYHGAVRLEGNRFTGPQGRLVEAVSVERLSGSGNLAESPLPEDGRAVEARLCGTVELDLRQAARS
ncbi:MAG: hypothetical protein EA425_07955 [Puniceicoccaceae bacterium]|nr:MAG: hypothetical protein EA425_07955 [Puniceicoccaceae bacterium]